MNQKILHEIGRSPRLDVINVLKRTEGLSVRELSDRMGMSYMGVKQHCQQLHKDGYLETWRRPRGQGMAGRPEMVYRLTRRAEALFPVASNPLAIGLLRSAESLFGPSAPEKLLFAYFEEMAEVYRSKLRGDDLRDRALWLARLRDSDGYMADLRDDDAGMAIVENHSPIRDLFDPYPLVRRLEEEMFGKILDCPVRREESQLGGLYECRFHLTAG